MSNITRTALDALSLTNFPDNTTQQISPADLRGWVESAVDSFVTQKDKSTFENAFYECKSSNITAVSGTTNLALATGNFVHITGGGSVSITSFGTLPAGSRFILNFELAVTLVYDSVQMILPGAANIVTAVGDSVMVVSEGGGNWRLIGYFPAAGLPVGTVTAVTASAPLSSSGGNAPDISIPQASGSTDGYLSSGDWTTFDSKQDALSAGTGISIASNTVTNTAPDQTVALTAGTGIGITGSYPNFTITNSSPSSGGTVTSVSGTAPIVSSGGNTPAISIPQASASVDGYLDNADWSTFNGKQDALVSGTNIKTVNSNSLLGSGNVSVGTVTSITAGTGLNGGTITGLGTIDLANTTVTPAAYTNANITVDAQGRITSASNGTGGGGNPGGANGNFQYKSGSSFSGASELNYQGGFVVAQTPKIGDSTTTGHFHIHRIASNPSGISEYLTVFWNRTLRALGFRHESETYISQISFTQPTADRTYTFPDASGNVLLDTATQTLTNKTLTTPNISTPAITGVTTFDNSTSAGEIRLKEPSGSGANYVAIKAQAMASDYSLTLPTTAGSSGAVLITDGSGGLSWATNGGTFATQFLRNYTTGTVTGTTANTLAHSVLIPAGTFSTNQGFRVETKISRPTNAIASTGVNIYINTSSAIGGITVGTISLGNGIGGVLVTRGFSITSSTTTIHNAAASASSDYATGINTSNIDWTINQYLVVAFQNPATTTVTNALATDIYPI